MDRVIALFDIETAESRFALTILGKNGGGGFVGEYFGVRPKYAPGKIIEMGSGRLQSDDAAELVARCKALIAGIDGPIQRVTERTGSSRGPAVVSLEVD